VTWLWLALGGALGTLGRYAVSGWVVDRFGPSPVGIFVVNVTGAFFIGLFVTLADGRLLVPPHVRQFIAIGVLGGYTTFSALSYETMQLMETGDFGAAALNALGTLAAGLAAVYVGTVVGRLL
jgi:CrcB protein